MKPLYEKYRPADWAEVIGQEKAVKRLETLEKSGQLLGNAFWISGKSGTGKTTIARIIARKIADQFNVAEFDAGELTTRTISEWRENEYYPPMGERRGRCYIVNEAHGLRSDVTRALLVFLEEMATRGHSCVIFTTTTDGQAEFEFAKHDAPALLSRCVTVALSQQGLCKPFAMAVKAILERENLDGRPIEDYERLAKREGNNFRAMLQAGQSGEW